MLADGQISEAEAEIINREAKRLHLSAEEVEVLIGNARRERELANEVSSLSLEKVALHSEHAVERYKTLFSEIRQLGLLTDRDRFERAAQSGDRLTSTELKVWREITAGAQTAPPAGT